MFKKHVRKYITMYPYMKDEEIPEPIEDFCEFIIQQHAGMADRFFKKHPEFIEEFLKHFSPSNGKSFHRGGYSNLDRSLLSASLNEEVAINFAKYGNNYDKHTTGVGNLMELTSELYYKTKCNIDNECEVFLWKPILIKEKYIL